MRKIFYLISMMVFVFLVPYVFAQSGLYQATISTDSGDYKASVEVEGNAVVYIHWPNGENTNVFGAKITDGRASGIDSKWNHIDIEIENYNSFERDIESVPSNTGEVRESISYNTGEIRESPQSNTGENRE